MFLVLQKLVILFLVPRLEMCLNWHWLTLTFPSHVCMMFSLSRNTRLEFAHYIPLVFTEHDSDISQWINYSFHLFCIFVKQQKPNKKKNHLFVMFLYMIGNQNLDREELLRCKCVISTCFILLRVSSNKNSTFVARLHFMYLKF